MKKVALVTGINSYPSHPLNVCVHDAEELSAALAMPEYGYDVSTLLDKAVTRKALKKQLEVFFHTEADDYVFYFSGHGWATDVGVYLVTSDADSDEEGIDLDYLKRLITNVAARNARVLVVLDCCHSGAATAKSLQEHFIDARSKDLTSAIPALPEGRVVLAACKGDELAYEDSTLGHGVFTLYLLQGLLGEAADDEGAVTVTGLYDYISRSMSQSGLQNPVFRGDIAGRSILGQGLMPRRQPLAPEERILVLEREAQQYLQEYQALVASSLGELEVWKAEGHKMACQTLAPILSWFERRLIEYPELRNRKAFMEPRMAAIQRLSTLSIVDAGTVTTEGIVQERLGAGTFGTVWKVQPSYQRSQLAYKVYHPQEFAEQEKVGRFKRGYEAMRQLDHPYIVRVHKLTDCPLGFYMDLIEGPNLRNFTGAIDEPVQLIQILLTVAETLKHAHTRRVVHRDVKPENIILSTDKSGNWRPFLTDFDLAWFSTASRLTKDAFGTLQYSAPEQMATPLAASAHAPTTDSFSFGQLCYYALTGSDPVPLDYANNYRALENRLRGGWIETAAQEFMRLYEDCTKHKHDQRPSFDLITDRLFKILQLLRDISPDQLMDEERFVKELIFSLVGLSSENQQTDTAFISLSGKTRVEVSVRNLQHRSADMILDFHCQHAPLLQGASTFDQMRKALMARISNVLTKFADTRLRHGSQAPFQVFIDQSSVTLNLEGVESIRSLISRVLEALEGS